MQHVKRKLTKATRGALSSSIIGRLVEAGYRTPGKIQDAEDSELRKVPGIGQAQLDEIRAILPKR